MTDPDLGSHQTRLERIRDRYLRHLPVDALTTSDAKTRALLLQAAEPASTSEASEAATDWTFLPRDDRGTPLTAEDQDFQNLLDPVQSLIGLQDAGKLSSEEIDAEQSLSTLFTALKGAPEGDVSSQLLDSGWHDAARAATIIVSNDHLSATVSLFELARGILLACASHRLPEPSPDPASFDSSQVWGIPAPRIESAGGLLMVASRENPVTDEVLGTINDLSADPSPEVRFQVARYLPLLRHSGDATWRLVDEMKGDASTAVLSTLVSGLPRLTSSDTAERVSNNIRDLLVRGQAPVAGAEVLRNRCTLALATVYIWRGGETAGDILREKISSTLATAPEDFAQLALIVRDAYAHGDSSGDSREAAIRARAIEFSRILLESATSALNVHVSQLGQSDDDSIMKRARATAQIIDGIASDLYFASGAYEVHKGAEPRISSDRLDRLYRETAPLLDLLGEVPIANVTHHVLETLSVCIPFDPKGVFLRIAHTINAGKGGDYQLDSLGATLVVKLLERYLAEHRTLLQTNSECQTALIQILDVFVNAGWPEARRLTYGLEEIFR